MGDGTVDQSERLRRQIGGKNMTAPRRPSRGRYPGWDYVIRSYDERGRFMVETTHRGEEAKDMELRAIAACGRTAEVFKVKRDGTVVGVN